MGQYTKAQAISIVVACAEQYRENLANKNLLFICQDKHKKITAIEFSFDASNFLHLTGLKVKKISTKVTTRTIPSVRRTSMKSALHTDSV